MEATLHSPREQYIYIYIYAYFGQRLFIYKPQYGDHMDTDAEDEKY